MRTQVLSHQILFNTTSSVQELEDWLADNCRGMTRVSFEGMSDDRRVKALRISFEWLEDKEKFKAFIQNRRRGAA